MFIKTSSRHCVTSQMKELCPVRGSGTTSEVSCPSVCSLFKLQLQSILTRLSDSWNRNLQSIFNVRRPGNQTRQRDTEHPSCSSPRSAAFQSEIPQVRNDDDTSIQQQSFRPVSIKVDLYFLDLQSGDPYLCLPGVCVCV